LNGIKKKKEEESSTVWMTTYSDLVTLLLVFFVLLFSFSTMNISKFKQFIASFQGMGILDGGVAAITEYEPLSEAHNQDTGFAEAIIMDRARELMDAYQAVKNYLAENDLETLVEVRYEDRGIALDIKESILFDSGKADLKPPAQELLDRLAGLLGQINNEVLVEGYTDNRPIHTVQFPTNWELSTSRAVTVVRYFIEQQHLPPERFVAVGYGEYRPLRPNDTPENMAANRRVVLLIGVNSRAPGKEVNSSAFQSAH
jgi:chemotaxis protein MotB